MNTPIRTFKKRTGRKNRSFGVFACFDCGSEFDRRLDHHSGAFDRCKPCTDKNSGKLRSTHGHNNANSRLHVTWGNMKRRCANPTEKEKKIYSHVSLCEEWMDYEPFMVWAMANGYDDTKTIDRIDVLKGYEPSNCRFVDVSTQNANKRKYRETVSGYLGVNWEKGKWRAKVQWRGRQVHLGSHPRAIDAARFRDRYIIENGWPHMLNFPDERK